MRRSTIHWTALGVLSIAAACSASNPSKLGDDDDGSGAGVHAGGTGTGGAGIGNTGNTDGGFDPGDDGGTGVICDSGPDEDEDGDGYTTNQGDCNDCDENVNPGAIEVPTDPEDEEAEPADEDCDGEIDEPLEDCDVGLALDSLDPMDGARAIDLCQQSDGNSWGVVSAAYVRANGSPASPGAMVGIQPNFGPNVAPRHGAAMLAISSGYARIPGQPSACGTNSCQIGLDGTAPPGFPQDVPGCDGALDIHDDVALEIQLKPPTNADGYSFDFSFYSFEYPEWVCTDFNDQFIALVNPPPQGSVNGNISFDSQLNPVSVNIAFFEVCPGCPLGTAELQGNGFDGAWGDDAGATSWLVTQAPVESLGNITIRWAIWDTGDMAWDSTTLIDNFTWIAQAGTVTVGTTPVPH